MYYSLLQALSPAIGLIINISTQFFAFRYLSRLTLLKSLFLGFGIGVVAMFALEFYLCFYLATSARDSLCVVIVNTVIYSLFGYFYFTFINLGETARRVRILRELHDSEQGLTLAEILERYNAKDMVVKRLKRLLDNHQIILRDGKYYIGSPIMLLIAKTMIIMKQILLGKKSEFD